MTSFISVSARNHLMLSCDLSKRPHGHHVTSQAPIAAFNKKGFLKKFRGFDSTSTLHILNLIETFQASDGSVEHNIRVFIKVREKVYSDAHSPKNYVLYVHVAIIYLGNE